VRQLLTESVLLAVFGTLGGLLLSLAGLQAFTLAVADQELPYWMTFTMDVRVFVYVGAVCAVTSVLFGLAPAVHASKVDLGHTLKDAARGITAGRSRWTSHLLVVTEVSLALVLLVGAGLMIRSFQTLSSMSAGLEDEHVLTMTIPLTGSKYVDRKARIAVLERLEPELLNTAGVEEVALASSLPMSWAPQVRIDLDDRESADPDDRPAVASVEISSQYFDVLGVPLLRGRTFQTNEGRQGEKVAIVNRRFVDEYWSGQDPIGRRIRIFLESSYEDTRQAWVTVVGEAGNIKQSSGAYPNLAEMEPVIYVPYLQDQESRALAVLGRARGDAHALAAPLRNAVQKVADLAVDPILTLPEYFARTRWIMRVFGTLFAIFAVIGLLLAAVGIYAIIAYAVKQRTHEIGIRAALGASQGSIVRLVVTQGLKLSVVGLALGLVATFAVTRVMRGFLIGVTPTDPVTIVTVSVLLSVVAVIASYLPTRRTAAVDPVIALRAEC
jgi:putative ABC transport system permease protein